MTTITNSNPKRMNIPALKFGFLSNISMAWKMVLLTTTLFLGLLGITLTGYFGLKSLRYQISNIYDFMLIPIVAINHADTALADMQYEIENLNELSAGELIQRTEIIQTNIKTISEIITRYDAEWVTTVSPEFTQALRKAGKLDLQEQEVAALARFHSSFEAFLGVYDAYVTTLQTGKEAEDLEKKTYEYLALARADLHELIDISDQYADFSNQQAQEAYRRALSTGGIVLTIALFLSLTIPYLIATSITSRLGELTQSATAMQQGDLDQVVSVTGRDEVGLLGTAFNIMSQQLKELFGMLEQRVADRTRALETSTEVSRRLSTILDQHQLVREVVEQVQSAFNYYHAHIYILNETGDELIMAGGTGEAGQTMLAKGHKLPKGKGLVGRAAETNQPVLVPDTSKDPDWLPNPLLPETRSEIAVPISIGSRVLGVLDVQHNIVEGLGQDDATLLQSIANQVAIALQNARAYTETQQQAHREALISSIGQKIRGATTLESVLQVAARELGRSLGVRETRVIVNLEKSIPS